MFRRFASRLVAAIAAVTVLGCGGEPMSPSGPSTLHSSFPAAGSARGSSEFNTVSWACVTGAIEREGFAGGSWTFQLARCPSIGVAYTTSGLSSAPLFSPAPTNLRAAVTETTVQLDWDQPPGATAWQLEAGSAPGSSNVAIFRTTAGPSLTVTGVPPGAYFVRVRSATPDFSDLSLPSNEVSVVVGSCAARPAAPSGFSASVVGNQVSLFWNPPPGVPPSSYVLQVGSARGLSDVLVVDTRSDATSLHGTAPNGLYFGRVLARNACGTSGPSQDALAAVGVVLPPPPVADFSFSRYAIGSVCSYRGCLFDATKSTGTALTYFWDFGDGTTGTGLFVLHVYARPPFFRQFTVQLTVIDTFGRANTTARNLYLDPNY